MKKEFVFYLAVLIFFLFPFLGLAIYDTTSFYISPLYTFGIKDTKDFFIVWITLFGTVGVVFNIYGLRKQIFHQQKQIELQTKKQWDDNFYRGIELLSSNEESTRVGAVNILYYMLENSLEEEKTKIINILCSHIRTSTKNDSYKLRFTNRPSEDIQQIINLLSQKFNNYKLDFHSSYLVGTKFISCYLNESNFEQANLTNCTFNRTYLKKSNLSNSLMDSINIDSSDLAHANLRDSKISNAKIKNSHLENIDAYQTHISDTFIMNSNLDQAKFVLTVFVNTHIEDSYLGNTILPKKDWESNMRITLNNND